MHSPGPGPGCDPAPWDSALPNYHISNRQEESQCWLGTHWLWNLFIMYPAAAVTKWFHNGWLCLDLILDRLQVERHCWWWTPWLWPDLVLYMVWDLELYGLLPDMCNCPIIRWPAVYWEATMSKTPVSAAHDSMMGWLSAAQLSSCQQGDWKNMVSSRQRSTCHHQGKHHDLMGHRQGSRQIGRNWWATKEEQISEGS